MTIENSLKVRTKPIQRLVARLLRLQGYSTTQIGAMIGVAPSAALSITRSVTNENLASMTLADLGTADDNSGLYDRLMAAAQTFMAARIKAVQPGAPRGQEART